MAERLTVGVAARLSRYLQVLTQAKKMGKDRISSQEISEYTNINATQIRRDLSSFGRFGKRGVGYNIDSLLGEIRKILRTQGQHNIALVGAGRLGAAIASSPIFAEHGITIAAVFDSDPAKVGRVDRRRRRQRRSTRSTSSSASGTSSSASSPCPADAAQSAADALVGAGVKIIFNYSQALLDDAGGRAGAHLEPGRRAALRALLPPDLTPPSDGRGVPQPPSASRHRVRAGLQAGCDHAHPPLARLPARRHRLERLHAHARARVEPRRARRHRPLPGAAPRALRPRQRRRPCGPTSAGCCRCSSSTATRATTCGACRTARRAELDALGRGERRRVRALLPADVVFTNHVLLGGPVGAATGAPFAVKAHGSELEYSMRGNAALSAWGAEALAAARGDVRRLGAHPHRCSREVCGHAENVIEVPPGVDVDEWVPEPRDVALAGAARGGAPRPAEPGQRRGAPARRGQRRRGSTRFLAPATARRRLLRQADRAEGRARADRGARRDRRAARRRRLRSRARGARGSAPRPRRRGAVHRPARAPPPPAPARARRRLRRAVDLPRGVRHGRGRGRGGRLPAARRPPLGARRGRRRARGGVSRRARATSRRSRPGDAPTSRAGSPSCSRSRRRTATRSGPRPARPSSSAGAGPASRGACSSRSPDATPRHAPATRRVRRRESRSAKAGSTTLSRSMGDEQRVPYDQLLREARERFDAGDRLHGRRRGGVRAPRPRLARPRQPLRGRAGGRGRDARPSAHLAGELIASEAEIKTGRVETFADVPATIAERRDAARRRSSSRSASRSAPPARTPGRTGRTSGSSTRRTTAATTRSSATSSGRTTRSASTSTSGSGAPTARSRSRRALRNWLPELLARLGELAVRRGRRHRASTRRGRRSSRGSSRAAASRRVRLAGPTTSATSGSSTTPARSTSTPSCGGACGRISPSRRSRSGSATASPTSPSRSRSRRCASRSTARIARAIDEGEPIVAPAAPPDRGEHVAGDPLRPLRRADRPRARDVLPARARIERLIEWVLPVAERDRRRRLAARSGAERGRAPDRALRRGRRPRRDLRRPRRSARRASADGTIDEPSNDGPVRQAAPELVLHNLARRSVSALSL